LNIDIAGEFIVMAANLIYLKAGAFCRWTSGRRMKRRPRMIRAGI
jgi:hypothetical protein